MTDAVQTAADPGSASSACGQQAFDESRQNPPQTQFDVDHRVAEAWIGPVEGGDLWTGRGHLPEPRPTTRSLSR